MTSFLNWFTARNGLLRKTCVTAVCLLLDAPSAWCIGGPKRRGKGGRLVPDQPGPMRKTNRNSLLGFATFPANSVVNKMAQPRIRLGTIPTIKRFALSLGLTVGLGFAFVPSGCGSVHPVTQVPESIAAPIRTCAIKHNRHLPAENHTVTFEVELDYNRQVDSITLVDSDLGDEDLEACIASSIRSLTEEDLPLRRAENGERELATPQSRMLLGDPGAGHPGVLGNPAVLAACVASPPCLLSMVVLMGATVITVQIMVHAASTTAKPTATTTAPPIPIALPRKYPNQTCDEKVRIDLQAAMKAICNGFPGEPCKPQKSNAERLPLIACSVIKARIAAVTVCAAARQKVQDVCFKDAPEAGHEQQIEDLTRGITWCDALKLVNCAPGHPMSGL
jgi:hypothetical protein